MLSSTEAYHEAIVGDTRRIYLQAVIDIIDPDIVYGTVDSSGVSSACRPEQIHDKEMELIPYATLEPNRWVLNGQFKLFPLQRADHIGFLGDTLSGGEGVFSPAVWVEEHFSNVSILQACSIYFPTADWDGVAADFTVEVMQGGTAYYTKTVAGNTASSIALDGFTVNNPDAIRVTVTKWSKGNRRIRIPEIIPGLYEKWTGNEIAVFSLKHQGDVSCMTLPYGTCTIKMDNLSRRFEPRSKNGVFQSIEERQGIPVSIGVRLSDDTVEYKPAGVFYQYSGGWKTGDNGLTMQWDLVDIVGLLADREFIPPPILPTTLSGWIAALVAQMGENFAGMYAVDPNYASAEASVRAADDLVGMTCGDILRYVCMATGTWPRADAETGYLTAEPMWNQGSKITLDNLVDYPTMKANTDIAALFFTLNDGNDTQYVVSGNSTASNETKSIQNPFIKTQSQALTAARAILSTYGGNKLEIVGRGDPASEIGDVDTVWLNESTATTGRRIQQDLSLQDGVLRNCSSVLLQADGIFLYDGMEVITSSGVWTAPAGATQLRIILVGKGEDGGHGEPGTMGRQESEDGYGYSERGEYGADGSDGAGGKVWTATIDINPQQSFEVSFDGFNTIFGPYSSANGNTYPQGYSDVASGESYARTGVASPKPGSGDGGAGGKGGAPGYGVYKHYTWAGGGSTTFKVLVEPEPGKPGAAGAQGCAVIYWDKEG
nr:MAG TPA: hypothetical protein [Caudoviricetes sp.]